MKDILSQHIISIHIYYVSFLNIWHINGISCGCFEVSLWFVSPKESSQQVATDPKKPLVRKLRQAMPAKPKPKPEPKATGFVRLELVESTSEEEDGKNEVSSEDEEISLEQDSHLRVLHRLESSAPTGECPWDVWLQATRSWPQLKTKLNSPDFCRQNGDLCVNFDVELLKKLIQEEKAARAAARQARIDDQENQKNRVNEYIEEAERRREMIKGRIGGFLLAVRNWKKLSEGRPCRPKPKRTPSIHRHGPQRSHDYDHLPMDPMDRLDKLMQ